MIKISSMLTTGLMVWVLFSGGAMAYEEPEYKILQSNDAYEIRQYKDWLAVQTVQVQGSNSAFRRLFSYISGSNEASSKISMTVPVTQTYQNGVAQIQFYLPEAFTKETAPVPSHKSVKLVTVPGGYYAVIQYSGRSTGKNYQTRAAHLKRHLQEASVTILGPSIKATYNGPLKPFS
jgi:effector-binding domain-containing protein